MKATSSGDSAGQPGATASGALSAGRAA
jgi:hypothetical protein